MGQHMHAFLNVDQKQGGFGTEPADHRIVLFCRGEQKGNCRPALARTR